MFWVRRYHKQVDLLGTDVITVKSGRVTQSFLKFGLNWRKEIFVF